MQINGRRKMPVGKIQETFDITVEEANKQIDAWAAKLKRWL
jgi:uncharacterized protein YjbJ (UPF0337 family)